jgi:hypothetical protein
MGWNWRRRVNIGPARINLSKKGIGFSLGTTGFRIGTDAEGKQYTQASIPGTGIYNRSYWALGPRKRLVGVILLIVTLVGIGLTILLKP